MITLRINHKEYEPITMAKTTRINGIDNFSAVVIPDDIDSFTNDLLTNKIVEILEDNKIIFTGYAENPTSTINQVNFNVLGKLGLIKRQTLPYNIIFTNKDLITFLNQNPWGIIFVDHSLEDYQKTFSIKFSLQSYFEALIELARTYGFYFWYNYQLDICYLGQPDKEIKIDNNDIINGKFSFENFNIQTQDMANLLNVYGGGIDKTTIDVTSQDLQIALGYTVQQQIDPYFENSQPVFIIKDEESITKYGIYADNVIDSSVNAENLTNEAKIRASNLLYTLAATELVNRKDPLIILDNAKYYQDNNSNPVDFDNGSFFSLFANQNPYDENSKDISGKYIISEINYNFDHDSTEGVYICKLSNRLKSLSQINKVTRNIARVDSRSQTGTKTTTINLLTNSTMGTESKEFSIDTTLKKVITYEMYLKVTGSAFGYAKFQVLLDGLDISNLFQNNLGIVNVVAKRFPEVLNIDILSNNLLTADLIDTILNNEEGNKHTLEIDYLEGNIPIIVETSIIIQAEI